MTSRGNAFPLCDARHGFARRPLRAPSRRDVALAALAGEDSPAPPRASPARLLGGADGGEDLLELLGGVHVSVAVELGVDLVAVDHNLERAGRVRGGLAHAISLGVFGLDGILHCLVLGGVACEGDERGGGAVSVAEVGEAARRRVGGSSPRSRRHPAGHGRTRDASARKRGETRTSASAVRDVNLDHVRERGVKSADEGTSEYGDGDDGASECVTMKTLEPRATRTNLNGPASLISQT